MDAWQVWALQDALYGGPLLYRRTAPLPLVKCVCKGMCEVVRIDFGQRTLVYVAEQSIKSGGALEMLQQMIEGTLQGKADVISKPSCAKDTSLIPCADQLLN